MSECLAVNVSDTSLMVMYGDIDLTGGIVSNESDAVLVELDTSEPTVATSINGNASAVDASRIISGKLTLKLITGSDELETLKELSLLQSDDGLRPQLLTVDSLNTGLHIEMTCGMLGGQSVLFRSGGGSQLYEEVVFTFARVRNYKRPNKG